MTLTFKLVRTRKQTSSVWIWHKSVQQFPRYFIHKQKTTDWRRQKQKLPQFTACSNSHQDYYWASVRDYWVYSIAQLHFMGFTSKDLKYLANNVGRLVSETIYVVEWRINVCETRMWANAQPDGRPAEHRWRPLFNVAKFGWRPLIDAVH